MLSETGWEKLLPVCDGAMLDLKAWGSECHQQLTGRDNQQIKRSICLLAERGKLAELRLLVIPDRWIICITSMSWRRLSRDLAMFRFA